MEIRIKGKSPTKIIERFLKRHGWKRSNIGGWILPGKYLVQNMQEAFQAQRAIFIRQTPEIALRKSELELFLEKLGDNV